MFDVQFSFKEIEKKAKMEAKIEGKIEGKMEAKTETAIEIAKKLLCNGLPIKLISDSTGLDEELIEQLELNINEKPVLS